MLVPSGPAGMHLFMLIVGPVVVQNYGQHEQMLMVSATTLRPELPHDNACVLNAGDHPFIQHPSYVTYRHARLDARAHIVEMVRSGVWVPHEPCSDDLAARVLYGMRVSRLAPREFKSLLPPP